MTIKHIVISGGGPIMVQILGALQCLENNNFFDFNNIESIYGTSAGAIVGTLLCMRFDWQTIYDYIIKRPWHDVFEIKVENILESFHSKGIFDIKVIEKCFKPLFDAKDIPLDISMYDFYKLCNIELHFFTFDINEFKITDISHITHPDLKLLKALQMTCGLPLLLKPVCIEDKCFIDGGLVCNYPLNYCIESGKSEDEILGFKNKYSDRKNIIDDSSTLLDYLFNLLFKTITHLSTDNEQKQIKYEILCNAEYLTLDMLKDALSNIEIRKDLFNNGFNTGMSFIENLQNSV
jgi:predicted acylesterase/phospholipase RssA